MAGIEALGFGVDLLGSMLNYQSQTNANNTNMAMNQANIEYQREAAEKQMQFQREERLATQEYNSPANQAKLYSEAGLNPYMMMEKGTSFTPSVAQSGSALGAPSMIPYQAQQFDLSSLSQSVNSLFDNKIKREQAEALQYQNDNKELTYRLDILNRLAELDQKETLTANEKVQKNILESALRVSVATEKYRISQSRADSEASQAQVDMTNQQIFDYVVQRPVRFALQSMNLRISQQQENEIIARISLLYQQAETEGYTRKQIRANIKKIGAETLKIGQNTRIDEPKAQAADAGSTVLDGFADKVEEGMNWIKSKF